MTIISSKNLKWASILLLSASIAPNVMAGADPSAYGLGAAPSGAQEGQCYARVQIPAQYSSQQKTMLTEEEYTTVQVTQPKLEAQTQQVQVKEQSVHYEVRQPTFKTVTEQMMVRPAYEKLAVSPPQFRTIRQTINTSAPRRVWKRGTPTALSAKGYKIVSVANAGNNGRGYSSMSQYKANNQAAGTTCGPDCEIWCLVEEPGQSTSFNRKIMTAPGRVARVPVAARYTSITKQVVADPGGVREIAMPAKYKSVTVETIIDPGSAQMVNVPAKYSNIAIKTLTSSERYEWRRVVCDPAKGRGGVSYTTPNSYNSGTYGARTSSYTGSHSGYGNASSYSNYSGASANNSTSRSYDGVYFKPANSGATGYARAIGNSGYSRSNAYGTGYSSSSSPYGSTSPQAASSSSRYYYGSDQRVHKIRE